MIERSRKVFTLRDFCICMGHGAMSKQSLSEKKLIRQAGWVEYVCWLLGRRRRFLVRENSMEPTLMPGDTVLAVMGNTGVEVGDIVIVRWSSAMDQRAMIEQCSNQREGVVNTSSLLLIKRVGEIFYDGGVYLISDNAKELHARDSRHFGVVDSNQVIGHVTSRLASSL